MTDKSNVIRKYDYEKYKLLIPFSEVLGKRRKQFVFSELEKMHPCFSDEFAFDSEVKAFRKNGLESEVLVMNKYKLAEYEGLRRFSGSGFFIEDESKIYGKLKRKRYFVNAKWKATLWGVIFCIFLAATGAAGGAFASSKSYEIKSEALEEPEIIVEKSINYTPVEIIFLDAVAEANGKIKSFEWKLNGYNLNLSASVKGVFPEKFGDGVTDTVIYDNGIPLLNVSYQARLNPPKLPAQPHPQAAAALPATDKDFNKLLRTIITDTGCVLREEKTSPYHIEFMCTKNSDKERLFEKLTDAISKHNKAVTFACLKQTGEFELFAGLTIETVPVKGFDLKLISRNLPLFTPEKISLIPAAPAAPVPSVASTKSSPRKIGEIKRPENTKIFYINAQGKLEVSQ